MATTNHQVTNQTCLLLLVVWFEVIATEKVTDKDNEFINFLVLNEEIFNWNQVVRILAVETCFKLTFNTANRYLSLVTVGVRRLHPQCFSDLYVWDACCLIEVVHNLFTLELELLLVGHMPKISNSWTEIGRINVLIAVWWKGHILLNLTKTDIFLELKHAHLDDFTWEGIIHEKDKAVHLGNACSFMCQIDNFNFYNSVFI